MAARCVIEYIKRPHNDKVERPPFNLAQKLVNFEAEPKLNVVSHDEIVNDGRIQY
jgi:hypothetical protein